MIYVLGAIAALLLISILKPESEANTDDEMPPTGPQPTTANLKNGFPLELGDENIKVFQLQRMLNFIAAHRNLPYDIEKLELDGIFGDRTSEAAFNFLKLVFADAKRGVVTKEQFDRIGKELF